ncbi:MAG TPA: hypothetical protein PKA82_08240 [Pyrinomonadaceae bacterium]|nr:hypothetical protein [Pyrinomonadaceae bacterium]
MTAIAQKQRSKNDLIKEMAALMKANTPADLAKSYEIGKEYIARFGTEKDENTAKVKKFVEEYRLDAFYKAVDAKKAADAFSFGKDIIADQPENVSVLMNLGYAGFNAIAAGDKSYSSLIVTYSDKATELISAGKAPQSFAPFATKDEALAWLAYFSASALQGTDMKTAASYMWKTTKYDSSIRKSIEPYYFVAAYYEQVYSKLSKDNAEKARVDGAIDLMLDAYARAFKIAEDTKDPKLAEVKTRFEQVYKFRKGTDKLMPQFIDIAVSSPFADPAAFN